MHDTRNKDNVHIISCRINARACNIKVCAKLYLKDGRTNYIMPAKFHLSVSADFFKHLCLSFFSISHFIT